MAENGGKSGESHSARRGLAHTRKPAEARAGTSTTKLASDKNLTNPELPALLKENGLTPSDVAGLPLVTPRCAAALLGVSARELEEYRAVSRRKGRLVGPEWVALESTRAGGRGLVRYRIDRLQEYKEARSARAVHGITGLVDAREFSRQKLLSLLLEMSGVF